MKRIIVLIFFTVASCTKYVQVSAPPNQLISSSVFSDDNSATSALSGIYSHMMESPGNFIGQLPLVMGLYADELTNFSTDSRQIQFYSNSVSPNNTLLEIVWGNLYNYIFEANSAVEGLNDSKSISNTVKQQLLGEAKFIRAFNYFYLVNLFGDVPLITSTDYTTNAILSRTSQSAVYDQIIKDLTDAEGLLTADYSLSGGERVRPIKWAATALLARVYLFENNWALAEQKSTEIISQSSLFTLDSSLYDVFKKNSKETIWEMAPVYPGYNTWDGFNFILNSNPDNVTLNNDYIKDFEFNDQRRSAWIDSLINQGNTYYYSNKYTVKTGEEVDEYYIVMRIAEQYLIRAEARAELGESTATDDLNTIRNRAGLNNYIGPMDMSSLLDAIFHERKAELFCEWGHRWFDLKRTQKANNILSISKPEWQITDTLLPILQSDILNDPHLTQNPGY
jgi:hypothetical protein